MSADKPRGVDYLGTWARGQLNACVALLFRGDCTGEAGLDERENRDSKQSKARVAYSCRDSVDVAVSGTARSTCSPRQSTAEIWTASDRARHSRIEFG